MAQSNASRRSYFARKAIAAKAVRNGDPAPARRSGRSRPANDNATRTAPATAKLYGANLGRSMTTAMNDACLEAAGFDAHASY